MKSNEILDTMARANSLISYFTEVQIKLITTRKVSSDTEDHALAAAAVEAGNGISKIISILQSSFDALAEKAGIIDISVESKKPHLTLVKRKEKNDEKD